MAPYIFIPQTLYMFSVNSINTLFFFLIQTLQTTSVEVVIMDAPTLTNRSSLQASFCNTYSSPLVSSLQHLVINTFFPMLTHSSIDLGLCVHGRPRKQRQKGHLFGHSDPYRVSPVVNTSRQVGPWRLAGGIMRQYGYSRRPLVWVPFSHLSEFRRWWWKDVHQHSSLC